MKSLIKKFIPKNLLSWYHKGLALLSALVYGYPSNKMTVIGVTGTNGKSTTVALISKVLEIGGFKVGATSTVGFKIADKEWLNDKKMTMLGRFKLQSLLHEMVKAGCQYAVIEVSSEGIKQSRHLGINFDYAIFTNLTPEHLESHGGFENYRRAKGELFEHLTRKKRKKEKKKKISIVNLDDKHAEFFMKFKADKKFGFSIKNKNADLVAENIQVTTSGTSFQVKDVQINLKLIGAFNVENALPAIAIAQQEGIKLEKIKQGLESVQVVPGRMESIDEGQNFSVIVDYAPEPASMGKLYITIDVLRQAQHDNRVIHVLGSCGGGRDKARRPILGKMAGEKADIVIITNEDPYDDDPMQIINDVAVGSIEAGKIIDKDLFKILDRKQAIEKALSMAKENDLVLVTGKGSEQRMAVAGGKYVEWDDRAVIRKILHSN
ncbi:UDP-N-acetylmuramoyl-L-alanyl-D-glutamate--2,6-diaminopimelate ligase [Candidatus Falkowbacteria bacterium]|jgi:UDP-N-acetylmuramoyl-L-alanyl-D-glutamate--2,6-diaminopimelate ligase|nr:UDP-N-acetylmuramoyl-L-alanyl-D-glutamate--2,6-diaminopimelate ligase [Candidatus Falkowbacteria bacterium]MBT5503052.1 UDP-N-acetylmuramoyl-L-alanyl-D-glutamate--2,6-diaminopimelate ligase [Candidatus Falkowbacteria bacterium]MBT6574129.1 UDP-N-acetylmuramoyl-L-alanyl-D-glutamate--2,6-diaminopimelate ligase [Candidatus Falkowbacteria bacterium]MBT7348724.1 UDP-N-acetylmuramoyl-L-alanyl-D-glutamate--2,6-diaminopimelate ligase [Candidatus Falkowbacteria bacterium]MBT7500514.1 UDP-N-acetylmura